MENTAIQKIMDNTGRKPTECNCSQCKSQCKTPCLGTPDDILRLIDAGYTDKLAFTQWAVGLFIGKLPFSIPMVQAIQTDKGCVFFRDGLCELHDSGLKPTEGRLSYHNIKLENYIFELSLPWNVAKEWLDENNRTKILKIFIIMEYFK
jgi:hypothetical protein